MLMRTKTGAVALCLAAACCVCAGASGAEGRLIPKTVYTGRVCKPGSEVKYTCYLMADAPASDCAVYAMLEFDAERMGRMFDGFAAERMIPPGLVVCIDPGFLPAALPGAGRWYLRGEQFDQTGGDYAEFVIKELLPAAAERAGVTLSGDPDMHFVAGGSSGGNAAWCLAWYGHGYFRRAYLASPTFSAIRGGEDIPTLIRKTEAKPIRVYITLGDVEPDRVFGDSFAVGLSGYSSLCYAGYPCMLEYFPRGGHLAGKGSPDTMRRVMSFTWKDWRTKDVEVHSDQVRVYEIVERGGAWKTFDGAFPEGKDAETHAGTYRVKDGRICLVGKDGKLRVATREIDGVSALVFRKNAGRLFAAVPGRRFIFSFTVRKDGSLGAAYKHAPLHLAVDCRVVGAKDLCLQESTGRLLAATELGVQGIHHFGSTDVIIPLPEDVPATRVAIDGGWLYAASGDRMWRRPLRKDPPKQDTTVYAAEGEPRISAHHRFFTDAAGKKSVVLEGRFPSE